MVLVSIELFTSNNKWCSKSFKAFVRARSVSGEGDMEPTVDIRACDRGRDQLKVSVGDQPWSTH